MRKPYPSDLTDAQWQILEPLIPPEKTGGSHRSVSMREVVNTILYLNRTGCQWDMLPHDISSRSRNVSHTKCSLALCFLWIANHKRIPGRKPTHPVFGNTFLLRSRKMTTIAIESSADRSNDD